MIVKELNLIGFGKFENENLKLEEGINLIYGENESGKSTIHSFINGMFYGFLRPNVRTALYTEEYERYDPWNNNRYRGILRFKQNGKIYRIERNFTKGKEKTIVFDEKSGADITKTIDMGQNRIFQPGLHFFGFNTRVFSNTISIRQLGGRTDKELGDELRERLVNLSTSLDDEISVENAISQLRIYMEEIGTERAPTKPYAINLKKINRLEEAKKNILYKQEEYSSFLKKKEKLLQELYIKEERVKRLRQNLLDIENWQKTKILKEAKALKAEIQGIEFGIKKPLPYEQSIEEDYDKYDSIEEEKNKILWMEKESNIEILEKDYKSKQIKSIGYGILSFLVILGSAILLKLGKQFLGALLFIIGIGLFFNFMKTNRSLKKISQEIKNIQFKENKKIKELQNLEKIQKQLLAIYNVDSKKEFNELVTKIHLKNFNREKLTKELEVKRNLLERILGSSTIKGLEKELQDLDVNVVNNMDEEKIKGNINKAEENIMKIKIELNTIDINLGILEKKLSQLVEIEEEIEHRKAHQKELSNKLAAINLAIDTIERLSKDIQNQFVPEINKRVSSIADKITDRKYTRVRVSEDLDISVENPDTKEIISINNLSGGTIDQLYFGLRFGIISSMEEDKLPLILDDCFVQYDDNRLENIMEILSDIGKSRQIILFTCHKREKKIIEKMKINFNYLELT